MNILLSAYACEPDKGSEPGVGWTWAVELAKYNQVWVITRDNNESTITKYFKEHPNYRNNSLHFIFVGLPPKLTFWKKGRRGMRLYYLIWQNKAAKIAKIWHKKVHFDLVQHVTFVSYTQVSYMYRLNIPMIWGPIAGGENIPKGIHLNLSTKEKAIEIIRKISQKILLLSPSIRRTMKHAKLILVATEETKMKIPKKYKEKIMLLPAIGLEQLPVIRDKKQQSEKIKIVMAGRLIYWKAFDIGINAFLEIADKHPDVELHILGEGNQKEKLKISSGKYLNRQIFFEDSIQHDQIYDFFNGYDLFLNTSLRDSGCMTMMEAMGSGVPCIAIATGGPKILLSNFTNCMIFPTNYDDCIKQTAEKLEDFIINETMRIQVADAQLTYARNTFTIENKIKNLKAFYIR